MQLADALDVDILAVDDDMAGEEPGQWPGPQQPSRGRELAPESLRPFALALQIVDHVEIVFGVEGQRRPVQRAGLHTGQRLARICPPAQRLAGLVVALNAALPSAYGEKRTLGADSQPRRCKALGQRPATDLAVEAARYRGTGQFVDGFLGAEEAHHPVAIAPIGDEALVGEGRIEDGIDLLHGDKIATLGDLDFVVEKAIGGDLVPDQVCRGFCAGEIHLEHGRPRQPRRDFLAGKGTETGSEGQKRYQAEQS